MRMWDVMPGFSLFAMLLALLVTVVLVVGIVVLARTLGDGSAGPGRTSSDALRILEERYARGEIDRDEFIQRRDDLRS